MHERDHYLRVKLPLGQAWYSNTPAHAQKHLLGGKFEEERSRSDDAWSSEGAWLKEIKIQPVLGRSEHNCPVFASSLRPTCRPNHGQIEMKAELREMNYTQNRCPTWTQSAAVAEIVQNWKDEADAVAERSAYSPADIQVSKSHKRDHEGQEHVSYQLYVAKGSEVILLASLELQEEKTRNQTWNLRLTNYSGQMQIEMLFDGWSGQDKLQGQRQGSSGMACNRPSASSPGRAVCT